MASYLITDQPEAAAVRAREVPVADSTDVHEIPISQGRLRMCQESADYWARELPKYAGRQQSKADRWAIASGFVAALTGLSVFPTVENGGTWQTVAVSVAAFLAAAFALVPRVKNYGEMAGKAREIATLYGPLRGELLDAYEEMCDGQGTDAARRAVIDRFQAARARKDELRYLPVRT